MHIFWLWIRIQHCHLTLFCNKTVLRLSKKLITDEQPLFYINFVKLEGVKNCRKKLDFCQRPEDFHPWFMNTYWLQLDRDNLNQSFETLQILQWLNFANNIQWPTASEALPSPKKLHSHYFYHQVLLLYSQFYSLRPEI